MEVQPQPTERGLRLLAAHLRSLDLDAKPARQRLDERLGSELAWKLVFALTPCRRERRAA